MTVSRMLRHLRRDTSGAAMIEFAILGPAMIAMLMGIVVVGMQMRDFNSIRAAVADINRYTMIEYQKGNELTAEQVAQVAVAIASRQPYNLNADRLDSVVTEPATGVTGAKKYLVTLTYTPPELIELFHLGPPTIVQQQSIILPD